MPDKRPLRIPADVDSYASNPPFAIAGDDGSWELRFVLARPVSSESNLWLVVHGGRHFKNAWPGLQTVEPDGEGYVEVCSESDALKPLGASEDGGVFSFAVPTQGLEQGSRITASLWDTIVPTMAQPNKFFALMAMPPDAELATPLLQGDDYPEKVVGACMVDIVGGETRTLRAVAPSRAVPGFKISMLFRVEDQFGNVASRAPDTGVEEPSELIPVPGSSCCRMRTIAPDLQGVYRLEVEDPHTGTAAFTNPIEFAYSGPRILWGSLHGHTEMSDGVGSLERYLSYMRDECALDFAATADHDHLEGTPDELWSITQETVARFNDPGLFTVFLGYEWARWRKLGYGDRNVYYLNDHRPMFRSEDGHYPHPQELFAALEHEEALIIPHHPAHPGNHNDWRFHDPEKERLVEIYSIWGCSERDSSGQSGCMSEPHTGWQPSGFVQRALSLGWRVGFTADGDDHTGHPGDMTIRPRGQTGGLTAVYAEENTREAIWDALRKRRCYATTGERMILDFSLDGNPMGSEINISSNPERANGRTLKVRVFGTAPIQRIDIVRNNVDVHTVTPAELDSEFEWTDTDSLEDVNLAPTEHSPVPFTFYYLRVTQENGQVGWASPIWVLP